MKIGKVWIRNFRSISDTSFDVAGGMLAFAGGNESGKSNVLYALKKFLNRVDFEEEDFSQPFNDIPPTIEAEFTLTPEQNKKISELTGEKNIKAIKVSRKGNVYEIIEPKIKVELQKKVEEVKAVDTPDVVATTETTSEGEQDKQQTIPEQPVEAVPSPGAEQTLARVIPEEIDSVATEKALVDKKNQIENVILDMLPKAHLIDTLGDLISGDKIAITDLTPIVVNAAKTPGSKFEVLRRFLQLGDVTDIDLKIKDLTKRNSILNKKVGKISKMLSDSWRQETVMIRCFSDEKALTIQFKDCKNVQDEEDPSTWIWTLPENRSQGFRWYVTFYSQYLYGISKSENVIFLIDDAGAFLNKLAQENLLTEFKNITGADKDIQIIYSTHSKYMVDWDFKSHIYLVTKKPGIGSEVKERWWSKYSRNELPAPLNELGVTVAEDYLKHDSLIVEGYIDPVIIYGLERIFADKIPKNPFAGFSLLPGGGAVDSMQRLGILCKAIGKKEFLIFDSDETGIDGKTSAKSLGLVAEDISTIGTTDKFKIKTTEDLLPPSVYRKAANKVGKRQYPVQWQEIDTLHKTQELGVVEALRQRMENGMEIDPKEVTKFLLTYKWEIASKAIDDINTDSYSVDQKTAVIDFFVNLNTKLAER